jgi:hypothetical protein
MRAVLAALLVLAVAAVAKFPEAVLPIGSDTGMYATYARQILQGGRPYVDFYDVHPPLTYYYWVLVEALAGTDWSRTCIGAWGTFVPQACVGLLAHTLDLLLSCVAAGIAYAIARQAGLTRLSGLVAAVLVVWFANESMISMEGSTPTKLTLVPSTLAVYAYLRALGAGARAWWAVLAGGAGILAGLAKQPGLLTLVALAGYTFSLRGQNVGRALITGMAAGALLVIAPTLAYLAAVGSLGGFLDQAWRYNAERFLIGYWQTQAGLASPATRIDRVATQAAGLLFVGALIGGLRLWLTPAARQRHQALLLWWGIFSLVAIAGFREFAQVVPALALLAALGIEAMWQAAGRDGLGLGRPVAGRLALAALLGSIFVLTSSFQLIELRRALFERGPRGAPADPEQVATYLRQQAPPGQLFIWGNAGQVYALSGREPATRFVIAEFTNTTSPRPVLSRDQVIRDLEVHPPTAIVVDPHADEPGLELSRFPALAEVMEACYQRVPAGPSNWAVYVPSSAGVGCIRAGG